MIVYASTNGVEGKCASSREKVLGVHLTEQEVRMIVDESKRHKSGGIVFVIGPQELTEDQKERNEKNALRSIQQELRK